MLWMGCSFPGFDWVADCCILVCFFSYKNYLSCIVASLYIFKDKLLICDKALDIAGCDTVLCRQHLVNH